MFGFEKKTAVVLKISGMHCAHCAKRVTDVVSALPGASKVTVDLEAGTVSVLAGAKFSADNAAAAIKAAGFEVLL